MKAFSKWEIRLLPMPLVLFIIVIIFAGMDNTIGIGISFFLMIGFGIYDIYLLIRPAIEINEKFVRIGKNKIVINEVKEIKVLGKGKYYTVIVVKRSGEVIKSENVYKGDKILTFFEKILN